MSGLLSTAGPCTPADALAGGVLCVRHHGLGSTGVFLGPLIKSAVARHREFLAEAAAVRFTRNPMGLASALKKIGGLLHGSRIRSPLAEEASHRFFGNGLRGS